MNIMKDPKNFSFNFDWPKDVDENLNYWIYNKKQSIFSWKQNKKRDWTIIFKKY